MANIIKSDATLRAIKAPASGRDIWRDQRVPGLQLQVTSRGVMTWYLVAKFKGKAERFNLGHYIRGEDAEGQLALKMVATIVKDDQDRFHAKCPMK